MPNNLVVASQQPKHHNAQNRASVSRRTALLFTLLTHILRALALVTIAAHSTIPLHSLLSVVLVPPTTLIFALQRPLKSAPKTNTRTSASAGASKARSMLSLLPPRRSRLKLVIVAAAHLVGTLLILSSTRSAGAPRALLATHAAELPVVYVLTAFRDPTRRQASKSRAVLLVALAYILLWIDATHADHYVTRVRSGTASNQALQGKLESLRAAEQKVAGAVNRVAESDRVRRVTSFARDKIAGTTRSWKEHAHDPKSNPFQSSSSSVDDEQLAPRGVEFGVDSEDAGQRRRVLLAVVDPEEARDQSGVRGGKEQDGEHEEEQNGGPGLENQLDASAQIGTEDEARDDLDKALDSSESGGVDNHGEPAANASKDSDRQIPLDGQRGSSPTGVRSSSHAVRFGLILAVVSSMVGHSARETNRKLASELNGSKRAFSLVLVLSSFMSVLLYFIGSALSAVSGMVRLVVHAQQTSTSEHASIVTALIIGSCGILYLAVPLYTRAIALGGSGVASANPIRGQRAQLLIGLFISVVFSIALSGAVTSLPSMPAETAYLAPPAASFWTIAALFTKLAGLSIMTSGSTRHPNQAAELSTSDAATAVHHDDDDEDAANGTQPLNRLPFR